LGHIAVGTTWPDLTIILDVPPEIGLARTGRAPEGANAARRAARARRAHAGQRDMFGDTHADAIEARPLEFHRRVREIFLELPSFYPRPVHVIDATADAETIARRIEALLEESFA